MSRSFEGIVVNGQIRLVGDERLAESTRVVVILPEPPERTPRIASPRLADPKDLADFQMELEKGSADAKL